MNIFNVNGLVTSNEVSQKSFSFVNYLFISVYAILQYYCYFGIYFILPQTLHKFQISQYLFHKELCTINFIIFWVLFSSIHLFFLVKINKSKCISILLLVSMVVSNFGFIFDESLYYLSILLVVLITIINYLLEIFSLEYFEYTLNIRTLNTLNLLRSLIYCLSPCFNIYLHNLEFSLCYLFFGISLYLLFLITRFLPKIK